MAVRRGRRGSFLGCTQLSQVPRHGPDPRRAQGTARRAGRPPPRRPAADLKSIPVEETCEQCGGPMLVRRSRRGFFLGCAQYPKCKGTRQPGEATLAKINEVDRSLNGPRSRPCTVRARRQAVGRRRAWARGLARPRAMAYAVA